MNTKRNVWTMTALLLVAMQAMAQMDTIVKDPIADFLKLDIPDRYSDVSEVDRVVKITCDLTGKGEEDIFVGTSKMWLGDNFTLYAALYAPMNSGGYERLTPSNSDIAIDPRFFGPRETSYCGYIEERQAQGVLVLENNGVSRDPNDPGKLIQPEQYSARKFYHIDGDRLVIDDLGPLDLRTPEGKMFFNRYFGRDVKSRPIRYEDYPISKLEKLGYAVPDWKQPPEASPVQTPFQPAATPLLAQPTPFPPTVQKQPPQVIATVTPTSEPKKVSSKTWIVPIVILVAVVAGAIFFVSRKR